jgi:hypothetical protein
MQTNDGDLECVAYKTCTKLESCWEYINKVMKAIGSRVEKEEGILCFFLEAL